VGGDAPVPERIGFVGSIKWRETRGFGADEARALAAARVAVPGGETAKLVAVSRGGIERGAEVDEAFGPAELLAAWGRS
jgi:hypothetical protein